MVITILYINRPICTTERARGYNIVTRAKRAQRRHNRARGGGLGESRVQRTRATRRRRRRRRRADNGVLPPRVPSTRTVSHFFGRDAAAGGSRVRAIFIAFCARVNRTKPHCDDGSTTLPKTKTEKKKHTHTKKKKKKPVSLFLGTVVVVVVVFYPSPPCDGRCHRRRRHRCARTTAVT